MQISLTRLEVLTIAEVKQADRFEIKEIARELGLQGETVEAKRALIIEAIKGR